MTTPTYPVEMQTEDDVEAAQMKGQPTHRPEHLHPNDSVTGFYTYLDTRFMQTCEIVDTSAVENFFTDIVSDIRNAPRAKIHIWRKIADATQACRKEAAYVSEERGEMQMEEKESLIAKAMREREDEIRDLRKQVGDRDSKIKDLESKLANSERNLKAIEAQAQSNQARDRDQSEFEIKSAGEKLTVKYLEMTNKMKELRRQETELRKLHSVILKSSEKKADPFDDDKIRNKFNDLAAGIQRLVKRHCQNKRTNTRWREFDEIEAQDDKDYFLQSYIADTIEFYFFNLSEEHPSYIWGLGRNLDDALTDLEVLFRKNPNTRPDVVTWRVETMRLIKLLNLDSNTWYSQAENEIYRQIAEVTNDRLASKEGVKKAISTLIHQALDTAVSVRLCKSKFLWGQRWLLSEFKDLSEDVEWIDGYNVKAAKLSQKGQQAKIMFGPLYKRVDGQLATLRTGVVLRS